MKELDYNKALELIQEQNTKQTELLEKHEVKLSMYNDNECLLREIRDTVNHSMDILDKDNKLLASEYLYTVSSKVCEIISYIQTNGLTTLSKAEFDGFMINSLKDCEVKFSYIFGSDKAKAYFRNTLPVHSYKEELFVLLDDLRVNNVDRRFRTLTIKWLEELCANFIRTMFFKK